MDKGAVRAVRLPWALDPTGAAYLDEDDADALIVTASSLLEDAKAIQEFQWVVDAIDQQLQMHFGNGMHWLRFGIAGKPWISMMEKAGIGKAAAVELMRKIAAITRRGQMKLWCEIQAEDVEEEGEENPYSASNVNRRMHDIMLNYDGDQDRQSYLNCKGQPHEVDYEEATKALSSFYTHTKTPDHRRWLRAVDDELLDGADEWQARLKALADLLLRKRGASRRCKFDEGTCSVGCRYKGRDWAEPAEERAREQHKARDPDKFSNAPTKKKKKRDPDPKQRTLFDVGCAYDSSSEDDTPRSARKQRRRGGGDGGGGGGGARPARINTIMEDSDDEQPENASAGDPRSSGAEAATRNPNPGTYGGAGREQNAEPILPTTTIGGRRRRMGVDRGRDAPTEGRTASPNPAQTSATHRGEHREEIQRHDENIGTLARESSGGVGMVRRHAGAGPTGGSEETRRRTGDEEDDGAAHLRTATRNPLRRREDHDHSGTRDTGMAEDEETSSLHGHRGGAQVLGHSTETHREGRNLHSGRRDGRRVLEEGGAQRKQRHQAGRTDPYSRETTHPTAQAGHDHTWDQSRHDHELEGGSGSDVRITEPMGCGERHSRDDIHTSRQEGDGVLSHIGTEGKESADGHYGSDPPRGDGEGGTSSEATYTRPAHMDSGVGMGEPSMPDLQQSGFLEQEQGEQLQRLHPTRQATTTSRRDQDGRQSKATRRGGAETAQDTPMVQQMEQSHHHGREPTSESAASTVHEERRDMAEEDSGALLCIRPPVPQAHQHMDEPNMGTEGADRQRQMRTGVHHQDMEPSDEEMETQEHDSTGEPEGGGRERQTGTQELSPTQASKRNMEQSFGSAGALADPRGGKAQKGATTSSLKRKGEQQQQPNPKKTKPVQLGIRGFFNKPSQDGQQQEVQKQPGGRDVH